MSPSEQQERPGPGGLAIVGAVLSLVVAPFALLYLWIDSAMSQPTNGATYVTVDAVPVGSLPDVPSSGSANVELLQQAEVEVWDGKVDAAHFLPTDLTYGLAVGVVLLAVIVAIGVLRRRPANLFVVGWLGLMAVYAVVAAVAGPRAHDWAARRAIELSDLPTSAAAARRAGLDFTAAAPATDWSSWHSIYVVVAITCVGAAAYVLHLRSRTRPPRPAV